MLRLHALFLCFASLFTLLFSGTSRVELTVDGMPTGEAISDKVNTVNVWDMGTQFIGAQNDPEYDVFAFVDYVQLMQCSGGTATRDLLRDPLNTDVLDDYDFTRLVNNCRGILALGAKPFLKLGSVPLKYSDDPLLGGFGMNVRPPRDYDVYYNYIYALADTLVQAFGRDEVTSWRFGVMTEFENSDWFYAGDKDAQASTQEYCKLYDYTVQALLDAIGPDVFVGAHAMAVTEGLWDETEFIRHVAVGTNYASGRTGTRICYVSASFYDARPGKFTDGKTLPQTIGDLRKAAEQYGLCDLLYGVDEGRILTSAPGKDSAELVSRTVGYTWQAAYDARLWTQTIRSRIEWFSSWGYLSGGLHGYPTISYHVANAVHKMSGERQLGTTSTTAPLQRLTGIEVDGCASADGDTGTTHVLLYNFRNKLTYNKRADVKLTLSLPQFAGKTIRLREWRIDDGCNFFDEWQQDKKIYGITDDCASWSPDDPWLDSAATLSDPHARTVYFESLRDKYIQCAALSPTEQAVDVPADGMLTLRRTLPPSGVLFLEAF